MSPDGANCDGLERLIGAALPSLVLPSTVGGTVELSGLGCEGTGGAIVFLYPWSGRPGIANPPDWDNIPGAHGSTPEAEGFRDQYASFVGAGFQVYGLSGQSSGWQRELSDRLGLPFALLSDEPLALAQALRLPTFSTGGVTYLTRLTLVVRAGRIDDVVFPISDPGGHAGALIERLTAGSRSVGDATS
jgi:peroxiredoxin